MADRRFGGITLGGIIVILGIILIIVWSFWIGRASCRERVYSNV